MILQLSVVVCTYNRAELLMDALESLVCQSVDPSTYEILVVDNGSTDRTPELVRGFMAQHAHCRLFMEPQQGIAQARNRGYREAQAEWVAYVDSDEIVPPGYLQRILHVIQNYRFDCFGGVYEPLYKYGKPKWFRDSYATNGRLLDRVGVLESGEIAVGESAFRKSVLEKLGGFPTSLGMRGEKIGYGEETLLQVRMRQKGYVIGFDPELRVGHVMVPSRMTVRWWLKSAYCHGVAMWDAYEQSPKWRRVFKRFLELFYFSCRDSLRYTPQLRQGDYYLQNWLVDVVGPLALNWGMIVSGTRKLTVRSGNPGPPLVW